MRFSVAIKTDDGDVRTEEFHSNYDATFVLEKWVEDNLLKPGESIVHTPPPRARAGETYPAITRLS